MLEQTRSRFYTYSCLIQPQPSVAAMTYMTLSHRTSGKSTKSAKERVRCAKGSVPVLHACCMACLCHIATAYKPEPNGSACLNDATPRASRLTTISICPSLDHFVSCVWAM